MEGHGAEPDIHVEITPEDEAAGRDPQLSAAVEALLEELSPRP
jgi:tricorn protease